MVKMIEFVFDSVDNIMRKEEKAHYQHYLLFLSCVQCFLFRGHRNSGLYGKKLKDLDKFKVGMSHKMHSVLLFSKIRRNKEVIH